MGILYLLTKFEIDWCTYNRDYYQTDKTETEKKKRKKKKTTQRQLHTHTQIEIDTLSQCLNGSNNNLGLSRVTT